MVKESDFSKVSKDKNQKLSFKQLKKINQIEFKANDLEWSGLLALKYKMFFTFLSRFILLLTSITILSLVLIFIFITIRSPALLLAVYPNAKVVCVPHITNEKKERIILNKNYTDICEKLYEISGYKIDKKIVNSNSDAIGNIENKVIYTKISDLNEFNIQSSLNTSTQPTLSGDTL